MEVCVTYLMYKTWMDATISCAGIMRGTNAALEDTQIAGVVQRPCQIDGGPERAVFTRGRFMSALRAATVSDWEFHLCRQSVNCSSHSLIIWLICFCTASLTQSGYYNSGSGAGSCSSLQCIPRSAHCDRCTWATVLMDVLWTYSNTPVTWIASFADKPSGDRYWVSAISAVSNYVQRPSQHADSQRIQGK